jgi:hypothetical protein
MILHIIGLIVVGPAARALGWLFHPGRDAMGFVTTGIVGVASVQIAGLRLRRAAPAGALAAPDGVRLSLEGKGSSWAIARSG